MPWAPRPESVKTTCIRLETRCSCGSTWSAVAADSSPAEIERAQKLVTDAADDHICMVHQ